jgi:hypothetical protein
MTRRFEQYPQSIGDPPKTPELYLDVHLSITWGSRTWLDVLILELHCLKRGS